MKVNIMNNICLICKNNGDFQEIKNYCESVLLLDDSNIKGKYYKLIYLQFKQENDQALEIIHELRKKTHSIVDLDQIEN